MPSLYYAACCQTAFPCPTDREEIADRTRRMCTIVEEIAAGYEPFFDVRLFAFPEFAHAAPIYPDLATLRSRLALPVPNEFTDDYAKVAKKLGCYIQTGSFIEWDPNFPDVLFNATCLIGPSGVLSKYRKVNPWIPWEQMASPHDIKDYSDCLFPVAETELGRIGVATCYDWLFPEAIRQIALAGAEVIIRISAYMDPWGVASPMEWWTTINRARAIENMVYVVAVNQGAERQSYPPFSWPGGSMIVDFDGRILAQADPGPGEKIVVAPIAMDVLRAERARRVGHHLLAHFRSEVYTYWKGSYLSPAWREEAPEENRWTMHHLTQRIRQAKSRLGIGLSGPPSQQPQR
jgi:formamidase